MATRVYHWKHGWIPLTHEAALQKAHGSHAGAAKIMGGLHPVKNEHLPRQSHILAAHTPDRRFVLHDTKTGHTTTVPEKHGDSLHGDGHTITGVNPDGSLSTSRGNSSDPSSMTPEQLDAEVADLAAAGDFGPRMEALAAEMDRRDKAPAKVEIPAQPDPLAEQRALNKLLYGSEHPDFRDPTKSFKPSSRDRTKALRNEYDSWSMSQYIAATDATNGYLFKKEYRTERGGVHAPIGEEDFFNGRATPAQIRKYASPELLEWFGSHPRMSFDEFRANATGGKAARAARNRARERTLSEWG